MKNYFKNILLLVFSITMLTACQSDFDSLPPEVESFETEADVVVPTPVYPDEIDEQNLSLVDDEPYADFPVEVSDFQEEPEDDEDDVEEPEVFIEDESLIDCDTVLPEGKEACEDYNDNIDFHSGLDSTRNGSSRALDELPEGTN